MADSIKVNGLKEKYVSRSVDFAKITVVCVNPETCKKYEKTVSIPGADFDGDKLKALLFLVANNDKYLAIKEKTPAGNTTSFLAMPVEIKALETESKVYEISVSNLMKYGREKTEKKTEEK